MYLFNRRAFTGIGSIVGFFPYSVEKTETLIGTAEKVEMEEKSVE